MEHHSLFFIIIYNIIFCVSEKKITSCRFGYTWGWVNDGRSLLLGEQTLQLMLLPFKASAMPSKSEVSMSALVFGRFIISLSSWREHKQHYSLRPYTVILKPFTYKVNKHHNYIYHISWEFFHYARDCFFFPCILKLNNRFLCFIFHIHTYCIMSNGFHSLGECKTGGVVPWWYTRFEEDLADPQLKPFSHYCPPTLPVNSG